MTLPQPLEPLFSAEGRRGYIANSISRSVWETQSGAAILRALQGAGLGIREGDFYAIRREVLSLGYQEEAIGRLQPDSLVPRGWMQEREYTQLTSQAQYRFRMTVTDQDTGETQLIVRAISTDHHYTKQEAEDMIQGLFTLPSASSNYVVDEVDLYEIWVRPGALLER